LIDLVRNRFLKELLSEAESLLSAGEWQQSTIKSAEAMTRLMRMSSSYSPLGRVQNFYSITHGIHDGPTHQAIEKLVKSIEDIQEGITRQMQIVMGLDFKGYARYKHFAPIVHIMANNSTDTTFTNHDLNAAEAKWILEYVLGNVLRMEEAGLEWHEL
jgi:RecG-like helicase